MELLQALQKLQQILINILICQLKLGPLNNLQDDFPILLLDLFQICQQLIPKLAEILKGFLDKDIFFALFQVQVKQRKTGYWVHLLQQR
jgi:hypothetical protein